MLYNFLTMQIIIIFKQKTSFSKLYSVSPEYLKFLSWLKLETIIDRSVVFAKY